MNAVLVTTYARLYDIIPELRPFFAALRDTPADYPPELCAVTRARLFPNAKPQPVMPEYGGAAWMAGEPEEEI